jgi:hypothetical protein
MIGYYLIERIYDNSDNYVPGWYIYSENFNDWCPIPALEHSAVAKKFDCITDVMTFARTLTRWRQKIPSQLYWYSTISDSLHEFGFKPIAWADN